MLPGITDNGLPCPVQLCNVPQTQKDVFCHMSLFRQCLSQERGQVRLRCPLLCQAFHCGPVPKLTDSWTFDPFQKNMKSRSAHTPRSLIQSQNPMQLEILFSSILSLFCQQEWIYWYFCVFFMSRATARDFLVSCSCKPWHCSYQWWFLSQLFCGIMLFPQNKENDVSGQTPLDRSSQPTWHLSAAALCHFEETEIVACSAAFFLHRLCQKCVFQCWQHGFLQRKHLQKDPVMALATSISHLLIAFA